MHYSPVTGPLFLFALACFCLWFSVRAYLHSDAQLEAVKRYRFHHRTSGGVVTYRTYEQAELHRQQFRDAGMSLGPLSLCVIGSFVWTLYAAADLLEAL